MQETRIKSYFRQQVQEFIRQSELAPEGFRIYFANREPGDDEILGLLAASAMMSGQFAVDDDITNPVEALRALSRSSRLEICRQFRKELKNRLRKMADA